MNITPGARIAIVKKFNELGSYKKVMDFYKGKYSYWVVYNAVTGRSKRDYSGRSDKGKSRNMENVKSEPVNNEDTKPEEMKSPDQFDSLIDFLEYQITVAARDLGKRTYSPDFRIKLLEKISSLLKSVQSQKLEAWIKAPEATLIVNIMKRLAPKLNDEALLKIYNEERELLKRSLS